MNFYILQLGLVTENNRQKLKQTKNVCQRDKNLIRMKTNLYFKFVRFAALFFIGFASCQMFGAIHKRRQAPDCFFTFLVIFVSQ
jgi:hypothetical protein